MFGRKRKEEAARQEAERKREEQLAELSKPYCERTGKHMWRDFPPYLYYTYNGRQEYGHIWIYEPYACVLCGKQEEKILDEWQLTHFKRDDFYEKLEEIKKIYNGFIQPKGIVMDMVHDAIMVDRQKLKFWDQLHAPEKPEKEPFEFKLKENDYGILVNPKENNR